MACCQCRFHRYDDDIRRQSVYLQVNEARLAAAKKTVEEEKRQKDEEDRANRLEQEMKMVSWFKSVSWL